MTSKEDGIRCKKCGRLLDTTTDGVCQYCKDKEK